MWPWGVPCHFAWSTVDVQLKLNAFTSFYSMVLYLQQVCVLNKIWIVLWNRNVKCKVESLLTMKTSTETTKITVRKKSFIFLTQNERKTSADNKCWYGKCDRNRYSFLGFMSPESAGWKTVMKKAKVIAHRSQTVSLIKQMCIDGGAQSSC